MKSPKLKYDGRWTWFPKEENRQWTIISTFIDKNGQDRITGSFGLKTLKDFGIVPVRGESQ